MYAITYDSSTGTYVTRGSSQPYPGCGRNSYGASGCSAKSEPIDFEAAIRASRVRTIPMREMFPSATQRG